MLVRIANRCESLTLHSSVPICNETYRAKILRWLPKFKMAAVFHQNSEYSVSIGSSVLVRIANSCKSLALNNIVQICY